MNLSITRDGSSLHARLRLSGIDANGTATVDGRHITLAVELHGCAEPMLGEGACKIIQFDYEAQLVSDTELDLQLAPGASYRLRKQ